MKKQICVLMMCCLWALVSNAQKFEIYKGDTINRKDNKGLKEGVWRKYYRTDTLCSESVFLNDKPINVSRTWYESGKIKAIVNFNKVNTRYGVGTSYYESGKLMARGNYIDQLKDSTWIYYGENDSVKSIEVYKNGLPDKTWKVYYENGKMAEETKYVNGKRDGLHKEYNDDGVLIFEMNYKNDLSDGYSKLYYRDGKIRTSGSYKNGLREGVWIKYDNNGIKQQELLYNNGVSKDEVEPE